MFEFRQEQVWRITLVVQSSPSGCHQPWGLRCKIEGLLGSVGESCSPFEKSGGVAATGTI